MTVSYSTCELLTFGAVVFYAVFTLVLELIAKRFGWLGYGPGPEPDASSEPHDAPGLTPGAPHTQADAKATTTHLKENHHEHH